MHNALRIIILPIPLIMIVWAFWMGLSYNAYLESRDPSDGEALSVLEFALAQSKGVADFRTEDAAPGQKVAAFDIHSTLPKAPEGWRRVAYQDAHGAAIMGVVYDKELPFDSTEQLIHRDFIGLKEKAKESAKVSYVRGTEIIALQVKVNPKLDPFLLTTDPDAPLGPQELGHVAGISFELLPQISEQPDAPDYPVSYRRYLASVSSNLSIFVVTNAQDPQSVLDVINGFDMARLKTGANVVGGIPGAVVAADESATPKTAAKAEIAKEEDSPDGLFGKWRARVANAKAKYGKKTGDEAPASNIKESAVQAVKMNCRMEKTIKRCTITPVEK